MFVGALWCYRLAVSPQPPEEEPMDSRTSEQAFSKKLGQIAAKAWSDPAFKKRLLADPGAVSTEYGMPLPPGIELRVVEDTPAIRYFVLPPRPTLAELSDEQLEEVAGGTACSCFGAGTIQLAINE